MPTLVVPIFFCSKWHPLRWERHLNIFKLGLQFNHGMPSPSEHSAAQFGFAVRKRKFDGIFLQWNDAEVLIRWVSQRKSKDSVILAGNLQQTAPQNVLKTQDKELTAVPLTEDPWKSQIENKGGTGLAQASHQSRSPTMRRVTRMWSRSGTILQNLRRRLQHNNNRCNTIWR